MKNLDFKENSFWFKTLIYTGMQGYILLGIMQGVPTLFETMFHPLFIYISLNVMFCVSMIYLLFLTIKKEQITKKQCTTCVFIIPILTWSYIGQIGNSEAISILLGNSIGSLYNLALLPAYIFIYYKIIKSFKK